MNLHPGHQLDLRFAPLEKDLVATIAALPLGTGLVTPPSDGTFPGSLNPPPDPLPEGEGG